MKTFTTIASALVLMSTVAASAATIDSITCSIEVEVTTEDQANRIFQNPNATDAERQAAQEFYGKEKSKNLRPDANAHVIAWQKENGILPNNCTYTLQKNS
jgi:hypothetical protein